MRGLAAALRQQRRIGSSFHLRLLCSFCAASLSLYVLHPLGKVHCSWVALPLAMAAFAAAAVRALFVL